MNLKKLFILALFFIPIISMAQPDANFTINSSTLCEGDSVEFTNTSTDYTNLHWFFGDGNDTWARETPKHKYSTPGNYTIKLVAISVAGEDFKEQQITIQPKPNVQISVDPNNKIINLGEKAILSVSNGFSDYLWSTGETLASIEVFKEDYYWVKIHDSNNCFNSDTTYITVIQEDLSVSSNILTPNSDGYNDYLEIKDIQKYTSVKIYIYNIRNEQIYENSDYKNDWDGDNYPAGTYFFLLKTDGRRDKAGTINILR